MRANDRHVTLVAGARPNFMKIAPLIRALTTHNKKHPERAIPYTLVHTGQHYDAAMSGDFFKELGIPHPDVNLNVGSGTHAEQTAGIMLRFEKHLFANPTRMVVVVGDVNSTMACAVVAKKLRTAVAHVEAGLRSFDLAMPEEINRMVTDRLSDLLFTTDPAAEINLANEGAPPESVIAVGNVMIDTLRHNLEAARRVERFKKNKARGPYAFLTLHRPRNVDNRTTFKRLAKVLGELSGELPIIFARHPRTKARMEEFGISLPRSIKVTEPLSYLEALNLLVDAKVVLTDSGGLQEESTALGVPCITLRDNTERPITITEGTNVLAGSDPARIRAAFAEAMAGHCKAGRVPELWDGHASERIVAAIDGWLTEHGEA